MAHEIETFRGAPAIALAGEPAWHGLGTSKLADPYCSPIDAMIAAGLNWEAAEQGVFAPDGRKVEGYKLIMRPEDGAHLAVMSSDYHAIPHTRAFALLAPIVEGRAARWDCLASLRGGRTVFASLATRHTAEIVPGDKVKQYFLAATSYDGALSYTLGATVNRTVCANTLGENLGNGRNAFFRVRHTRNAWDRVVDAHKVIADAAEVFRGQVDVWRQIAAKPFTASQLDKVIARLFPTTAKPKAPTPIVASVDDILAATEAAGTLVAAEIVEAAQAKSQQRAKAMISEFFEAGKGSDIPGVRGTGWGAYNAITEYLTHSRGRASETRVVNNWFGSSGELRGEALETILSMVNLQAN